MADGQTPLPPLPESRVVAGRQRGFSLVWIIPIVASLAGAWVAVTRVLSEGPKITIAFSSAEGLQAGKTKIQYKGVDVGTLTAIRLSEDHQRAIATAQMESKTEDFLVDNTQFWVVRPRISGANVTGLGTLISGAYLGMEIGDSKESRRSFVALEVPPVVTNGASGRFFVLKAPDLGSLDTGTPVFFRRQNWTTRFRRWAEQPGRYACSQTISSVIPRRSCAVRKEDRSDRLPRISDNDRVDRGDCRRVRYFAAVAFLQPGLDGDCGQWSGYALCNHGRASLDTGFGRPATVRSPGRV